jgi:hypothetical protein
MAATSGAVAARELRTVDPATLELVGTVPTTPAGREAGRGLGDLACRYPGRP